MTTRVKNIIFIAYLIVVFFVIIAIWYSPIIFKGYPAEPMGSEIVLARNYAQTGVYGLEDDLNIVVAPELVSENANVSSLGNKFSALSYAVIFKVFGWQSWDNLLLIAAIILALACIVYTITLRFLFSPWVAAIFPFVFALLPFNWHTAQFLGQYEFAILYFSIFTFFYFWGREQKFKYVHVVIAGLFLGLACLAREAFLLFLPVFFIWLLYYKRRKEVLASFLPVALLLIFLWLPGLLGLDGHNNYLKFFSASESTHHVDFHFYGHVYPDPYTYHYNAEQVESELAKAIKSQDQGMLYKIGRIKVGMNMGVRQAGFFERILVGTTNLSRHISKFFAIEFIGGPFIFLLMILGLWQLKGTNKKLFILFIIWLVLVNLLLSYVALVVRSHLMDFGFVIATLVSLALVGILPLLQEYYNIQKFSKVVFILIILIALYSLVLSNHVYWGRIYDKSSNLEIKFLADKIKEKEINSTDVIAIGSRHGHPVLNYLTNKSIVYFDPTTIDDLLLDQKLQQAFDIYNVKYIAGYSEEMSNNIENNSQVENISIWPKKEDIEIPVSYNKMWLLNLVK